MTSPDEFTFKQGIKDCIPTILGYAGIGIAAGVVGRAANLSILEVTLMAIIIYAGASQFIATGMMLLSTPIAAIVLTVFLINSRHFLMSMATAPYFRKFSWQSNLGIGSLLTDETFAVSMSFISRRLSITDSWMHGLNLTAYFCWVFACFIGAVLGNWLPDPKAFGLDFALVAMFIGLLYLQLISHQKEMLITILFIMGSVVVVQIILMRFFSAELSLMVAALTGCSIGVLSEKWK